MKRLLSCTAILVAMTTLLAEPAALTETTVSVPWTEFRDILKRISPDSAIDTTRRNPPVDYTLSGAQYRITRASEHEFTVDAQLDLHVLSSGKWVQVDLGQPPAVLPPVSIDGKPGAAGRMSSGQWSLVLRGRGSHTVRYSFVVLMEEQAGKRLLRFPLPSHAAATASIELEQSGYVVSANGVPFSEQKSGSGAVYRGGLGSGQWASIQWLQEVAQISVKNAMVQVQLNTLYGIGLGVLQVSAEVNLSVYHQDIRSFALAIPDNLEVIDLSGPALAAWETADSSGTRLLHAYTKYSIRDKASFTLTAEMQFSDTLSRITLPVVTARGVNRQEGTAAVGVLGNVEISPLDNSANILRRDKRELPPWFEGEEDILYVYQYLSVPYRIELALTRHDNIPVLNAIGGTAAIQSVVRQDGKTITRMEIAVRNRGEQFLRLSWKPAWQLWSLYCNDKPARPALDSTAGELLVPLEKSSDQTAETRVKLVFLTRGSGFWPAGRRTFEYPSVNVPLQNISGTLYLPGDVKPFMRRGQLRDETQDPETKWFAILLNPSLLYGPFYMTREVASSSTDYYEKLPEERVAKLAVMEDEKKELSQPAAPTTAQPWALRKGTLRGVDTRGGGAGGADDEIGYLSQNAMPEPVQAQEMQQDKDFMQSQTRTMETGLLSIAVDLPVEGSPHPLQCVMLGEKTTPHYRFLYRRAPDRKPGWVILLEIVLTLAAGLALTRCMWSGWKRSMVLYGTVLPLAIMLVIDRYLGQPLYLDFLFILPLAWFAAMAIKTLAVRAGERMDWWFNLVDAVKRIRAGKQAGDETAPAIAATADAQGMETPPPLPKGKK